LSYSNLNLFESSLSNIFGFLLLGLLIPFAAPEMWQRIYAINDKKDVSKSIFFSSIIYLIFGSLLTIVALMIRESMPNLDPNIAFISGLTSMLPGGLVGLTIILLISAFMSSIDTYIYTASSSLIQNFYNSKNKNIVKKRIRLAMIIITLIGVSLTLLISNLVDSAFLTAFAVVLAIPVLTTWINPKIKSRTLSFGFIFGIIATLYFLSTEIGQDKISSAIIIKSMLATLFGLFVGFIFSKFSKLYSLFNLKV
jgi:Na+/proline symporter